MSRASGVAGLDVADVAVPAVIAGTMPGFAAAVRATVHVATFWKINVLSS